MNDRKREQEERSLGDVITRIMKAYQLDDKMIEMDVLARWEELMGRAVAVRTKKISIRNGVLHLELDSSVMREELMYGKSIIIQRINETAGKELIRDVWFS
ncbi:MAG: DUF721 domain-containing protein [Bacteroidetes bacterium]|nr:MAG: DUF721 domain-containing protein [Bacteroidota bacterium]